MEKTIQPVEITELSHTFGYNPASVRAVLEVETPNGGFLPDGRITILFERHWFYKLAKGPVYRPDLANPKPGGYATGDTPAERGAKEWDRLNAAMDIDRHAALLSTSWGKGQIMGFNHLAAGYATVEAMCADFSFSEYNQVKGMLTFTRHNRSMDFVLKTKQPGLSEWVIFASRYNGPGFRKNNYHKKLSAAYNRLK